LAFVLCGDRHVAEDVAAEAFARVWPHWRAGRVADDRSYLRKAVVNEVRSRWRRRAVERREERRHRVEPAATPAAERGGDHDVVVRAMATLPASQRAVIALRFLEDLSEAETAQLLDMRVGTVKSQTSRALARLRLVLDEEER
jgi:RNA polymerase sigma factor (sigma-70 family)